MPQAHRILEKPEMNPPRYYAIKAYGIGSQGTSDVSTES